jgi:hypothetical protein
MSTARKPAKGLPDKLQLSIYHDGGSHAEVRNPDDYQKCLAAVSCETKLELFHKTILKIFSHISIFCMRDGKYASEAGKISARVS